MHLEKRTVKMGRVSFEQHCSDSSKPPLCGTFSKKINTKGNMVFPFQTLACLLRPPDPLLEISKT